MASAGDRLAGGLGRQVSWYTVSAVLVLAGGCLELYGGGVPVAAARVVGAQLFYQGLLFLCAAYLYRAGGPVRDVLHLLAVELLFLLDVLFV